MDYTLDELYVRRNDLENMHLELDEFYGGWVGPVELQAIEEIHQRYDHDPEDWFSDIYQIEQGIRILEEETR